MLTRESVRRARQHVASLDISWEAQDELLALCDLAEAVVAGRGALVVARNRVPVVSQPRTKAHAAALSRILRAAGEAH